MANEITYDKAPGIFPAPFTLNMLFASNVDKLQFSLNQGTPAISKYVAYDTLEPPNPFIAVTQDGRGNVVYDGGFPKYYNEKAPFAGTVNYNKAYFVDAIRLRMTGNGTSNPRHYEKLSDKSVVIEAGDKLVFSIFQTSTLIRSGINATVSGSPSKALSAVSGLVDQNNLAFAPDTNTSNFSYNQWYTRTFDLTAIVGQTLSEWVLVNLASSNIAHTTWYKDIHVLNAAGEIKGDLFTNTLDFPTLTTAAGGSAGYIDISKKIVDVRDMLLPTAKYFFNCMKFIANTAKTSIGNRKVLFLGDAKPNENYSIMHDRATSFRRMLDWLCMCCGYVPTYKIITDYPVGKLDTRLEEMEEYCAIVMFSSVYQNVGMPSLITQECVDAFMTYRENGNGLMFVTDHGPIMRTIDEAIAAPIGGGFFATANRVVTGFGAWFSGNYDRTPVNVGFLRRTYGDHPLYDTLEDTETVSGGASESRVVVNQFKEMTPSEVPPILMPKGRNVLQVAAILNDGTVVTTRDIFHVATHTVKFTDGVVSAGAGQTFDVGIKNQSVLNLTFSSDVGAYNAAGVVNKNGTKVGAFTYTPTDGVVQTWDGLGLGAVKVNDADDFTVVLSAPLVESTKVIIKRFQPPIRGKRSLAEIMGMLRPWKPALNDVARVKDMIDNIGLLVPWLGLRRVLSIPINLKLLGDYFANIGTASQVLPNAATKVYTPTARSWLAPPNQLAHWIPPNPVTAEPMDLGWYVFSPVYGSERLPANFKMDYYTFFYFEKGNYRVYGQADDIFEFSIDGGLIISKGSRSETNFTIAESRFYALKVSNINTPVNTPGWWTCCIVNMTTGAIVLRPEPGMWKTEEYTSS